jgi:hypothetical protein
LYYLRYVTIGTIPDEQVGLTITLEADTDIDINIFDQNRSDTKSENTRIVGYCGETGCTPGLLAGPGRESMIYSGMQITYSGFNGVDEQQGHEYVRIQGPTTIPILMQAYAYVAGDVKVMYSWTGSQTACCLGTEECGGSFRKTLLQVWTYIHTHTHTHTYTKHS